MEIFYNSFKEIGYEYVKDTKTYIEFRTRECSPYERIKISKGTYDVTKDCKSRKGNRGWRSISYIELRKINSLINYYLLNTK